jgi:predicted DNA-binding transcriptional regulator AlpA
MADLLYIQELCKKLSMTESAIRGHVKRRSKSFPMPIKVGERRIAWRTSDVDRWLKSRPSLGSF